MEYNEKLNIPLYRKGEWGFREDSINIFIISFVLLYNNYIINMNFNRIYYVV